MQNIKIIELLNKIPISDIERLNELMNSTINQKSDILVLYNEIISNLNQPQKNNKKNLWYVLYKKQPLDDNHFRKLCFELFQSVEKMLGIIQLEKNDDTLKLMTLEYFSALPVENLYEDKWIKIKSKAKESSLLNSQKIFFEYSMELIQYDFLTNNPSKSKVNNISNTSETLDHYYVLQKLKLLCHAINESKFTNYNVQFTFQDAVIKMAESLPTRKNLLIDLYLNAYYLLNDIQSDEAFISLKKKLEVLGFIDDNELRILFQYVINYCIIELNKGKHNFESELFDIYKMYVQKINDKIFSPFRYKNIVNISLKQKQFDFATFFIDEYGKKLPKLHQHTTITFNKAKLQYELKNYDGVISILQNIKNDDLTFNLSAKVLLVKTFYEKKEFQFLESFLESFRIFILRNKEMNTASKKIHQDFIKVIHRLMKMEFASNKEIESFKNKIDMTENLPDKAWILEKTNNL
ncbi:MAG: hypothetical protein U0U67_16315 [Chitinophagales bacterium]